jgi:hypothetical protein
VASFEPLARATTVRHRVTDSPRLPQ